MTRSALLVPTIILGLGSPAHSQTYREYLIAGVCDQDCSDLDLALAEEHGAILSTDELDDDAPVLQFTSPADGLHTIRVTMYACSVEPCSFAYKAYRR